MHIMDRQRSHQAVPLNISSCCPLAMAYSRIVARVVCVKRKGLDAGPRAD